MNACSAGNDEQASCVRIKSVGASVVATFAYVVLSCLLGGGGEAEPWVYKCQAGADHSYQSLPCDGLELKRWSAAAVPVDEAARKRLEAIQLQLQRDKLVVMPSTRPRRQRQAAAPKPSACEKARQGRDQAYAKAGLRRNFAMSSFWDNKVHQACR